LGDVSNLRLYSGEDVYASASGYKVEHKTGGGSVQVTKKLIGSRSRTVERIACYANVCRVADAEKIGAIELCFYQSNGDDNWLDVRLNLEDAMELAADLLKQAVIERKNERKPEAH
jgi:hypothetical protein